jgi:hypothetical protein
VSDEDKAEPAPVRVRGLRLVPWIVLVVVVAALPMSLRVAWEGRAELRAAGEAAELGRLDEQIVHLGRAARWRLPIAGHDERALSELRTLGDRYQADGERELALAAYRELRRAIVATRAWRLPHRAAFSDVNRDIAGLMAEQERDFGRLPEGEDEETAMQARRDWHLQKLEEVPGPDPIGSRLAALFFVGWVASCVGFVMRGLDAQGRLRPRPGVRWGIACLLLLVVWMVLMRYPGLV